MVPNEQRWPRQLRLLAALSALLTLIAAGSAVLALSDTLRTGHELGQLSRAQRFHQDADMAHDALRADVEVARKLGSSRGSPRERENARSRAREDARTLRDNLRELSEVEVPRDIQPRVEDLQRAREDYVVLAQREVFSELSGQTEAVPNGQFDDAFNRLAEDQGVLTDILSARTEDVERSQDRHEFWIAGILVGSLVLVVGGWAVLVALLRGTGNRLVEALRREAEQRAVADELRRTLLPERLPDVPGLAIAARTRAADASMRVGGDWYDVICLPSGDVGFVVGDVVGHDLEAATAMTQLRAVLRASAVYERSPAAVLARLNRTADLLQVTELTTCLYAVVDRATHTVRWSSAGHLNPLVVPADGPGQVLPGDPGPPIGVSDDAVFVDQTCQLSPGCSLVMYTDGLVERRSSSISDNLARLESLQGADVEPDALCDRILELMLDDDPLMQDDVTVLALQQPSTPDTRP